MLPVYLLINSCGDKELLKAVQDFSKTGETADKTVAAIAEDFYHSCVRYYSFLPIEPIPTILQGRAPYQNRIEALKGCNSQWQVGDDFEKSNTILLKYIGTLNALASDKVVIFPDSTKEKLEKAINGLPFSRENNPNLTEERRVEIKANREQAVTAGVGIFQIISRVFLNEYREKQLSQVIGNTNDDVQTYTLILKKSVQRGYIEGYLQLEQDNIDLYYNLIVQGVLNQAFPNIDPNKPTTGLSLPLEPFTSIDDTWRAKRSEVNKRIEIGRLYIQFLDEVAQGHNELYLLVKRDNPKIKISSDEVSHIKEVALKRLNRLQNIGQKLEKELAK